jgi:opacity protein-like surface antigen
VRIRLRSSLVKAVLSIVSLFGTAFAQEGLTEKRFITSGAEEAWPLATVPTHTWAARLFITGGAGYSRFGSYLFGLDSSLKAYPHTFQGRMMWFGVGYQIRKSFSLSLEVSHNQLTGNGSWLDVDGTSPAEAAFLPVAAGITSLRTRGVMLLAQKNFFHTHRVSPYLEGGGGTGNMDTYFKGKVSAVDPSDGEPFKVAATDAVHRRIPAGLVGAGAEVRLHSGLAFTAGYRWNYGSVIFVGIKTYPFNMKGQSR